MNIQEQAKKYAISCHEEANHFYDKYPYEFHLQMVVAVCKKFKHYVEEGYYPYVEAGCWVHDLVEDTRVTYNDVKNALCEPIAEFAYALANEKGKTRKERANQKYYDGINAVRYASFIKLCDRYANMQYSLSERSSMGKKYADEMECFIDCLEHDGENVRNAFPLLVEALYSITATINLILDDEKTK
jgi:(p)ppGpp synthase/HD superfamily hydrolase